MKLTQGQLRAAELWRMAEGRPDAKGNVVGNFERANAQLKLAESVASGDFLPQILPAVRRTVQAVYHEIPRRHQDFTTRKQVLTIDVDEQVNVFAFGDQTKMLGTHEGDTFVPGGLPRLGPRELYPTLGATASGKTIRAGKFGEAFGVDWEGIIRSRGAAVDLIREGFRAFGQHAAQQEDINVAKLLISAAGYKTGAGEALENAKPATVANGFTVNNADLTDPSDIQAAIILANKTLLTVGTGSTFVLPVKYSSFTLLCLPEMEPKFRQVLGARTIRRNPGAPTGASWEEQIDFGGNITVLGWEWLRFMFPNMGRGWILIPTSLGAGDLPVLSSNYLIGYETPQVFLRDSNSYTVDGAEVDPLVDGDFDNDAATTKVRHVHGATALWTDGIVYSTGSNT